MDLKTGEDGSLSSDKTNISPKKRKVAPPSAANGTADNDTICSIKTKESVETQLVALALPKMACLFDAKAFTNKFKTEFGSGTKTKSSWPNLLLFKAVGAPSSNAQ